MFRKPSWRDWFLCAVAFLGYTIVATPFAIASGLSALELERDVGNLVQVAVIAIALPAFCEELVFRGPLIWGQAHFRRLPNWAIGVSLIAFVAWHPINALTFMPQAAPVFMDGRFLCLAGLLGATVTGLALATRSIWPPILFHWLVVVGWKAFLGAPRFL